MALWEIRIKGKKQARKLTLDYVPNPCDKHPVVRPCGEGDLECRDGLIAFVTVSAAPYDLISMPDGSLFMRQKEITGV